jgi:hypothetical protein
VGNQVLFEAYLQYCFSPKHTTGEQLLNVRRDKREHAAFATLGGGQEGDDTEEDDSDDNDEEFGIDIGSNLESIDGADT